MNNAVLSNDAYKLAWVDYNHSRITITFKSNDCANVNNRRYSIGGCKMRTVKAIEHASSPSQLASRIGHGKMVNPAISRLRVRVKKPEAIQWVPEPAQEQKCTA
jgi:hypothetical protein